MTSTTTAGEAMSAEPVDFDGLRIAWDPRVLRPRPWTAEQGRWAAEVAESAPAGPILELCAGAGQIGLVAARDSGRVLVQVDRDPVAVGYARANAAAAGLDAEVRCASLDAALRPEERFGVVVADPPWLRSDELTQFPEDPTGAVDGGADGFGLIRQCLEVGVAHLAPGGALLLQVGPDQVAQVSEHVREALPRHRVAAVRTYPRGAIVMVTDQSHPGPGKGDENDDEKQDGQQSEGQVSEVSAMRDPDEPISPSDAVAGSPDNEKEGDLQEGAAGPNARTGNEDPDKR
ncbi:methyltransferase [Nocardioides sp. zg-536]|uniref:Methyltransferase n=1 Tax=Nocardioides faecalis TaxID=2803858 RepID=A0A938YB91_9ACTN|nr:methyltransferase [Nocardioides faecalis]MBM9461468.1 methyltransferase [Nocardioides faecalis]MBS4751796.1 methyltransferase [Nocardioides faecalis]QVI59345.1 methyltransferase [Nocardioides faecalis]